MESQEMVEDWEQAVESTPSLAPGHFLVGEKVQFPPQKDAHGQLRGKDRD